MPKPKKITRVRAMKLDELSLVDSPANQHARVTMFKRATDLMKRAFGSAENVPEVSALTETLGETVEDILAKGGDPSEIQRALEEYGAAVLMKAGTNDEPDTDDVKKNCPKCGTVMKGGKCAKCMTKAGLTATTDTEESDMKLVEKLQRRAKALEKALTENDIELPEDEDVDVEPIDKSALSPAARERLEKLEKENGETRAALAELQKANRQRDRLAKATELTEHLPVKPEAVVALFEKLDDEGITSLESILRKTGKIAKQLGDEVGTSEGPAATAEAEIEKIAGELRKADPKLSKQQAIAKAYDLRPDLYEAEDDEVEYEDEAE